MAKVVHSLDFSTKDLGNELPRIPVRPPFILVFSPECWHVAAGRLVPQLLTYPAVDGVNQISRDRDGRWVRSKLELSTSAGCAPRDPGGVSGGLLSQSPLQPGTDPLGQDG